MIGTENLPGNLFHHQLAPLHHSLTQTWRKHTNKWYRYDASKIYQVIQFPFNFKRKRINILFAWKKQSHLYQYFLEKSVDTCPYWILQELAQHGTYYRIWWQQTKIFFYCLACLFRIFQNCIYKNPLPTPNTYIPRLKVIREALLSMWLMS